MEICIIFVVENINGIGMAHDRATSNPEIWRKPLLLDAERKLMEWMYWQ